MSTSDDSEHQAEQPLDHSEAMLLRYQQHLLLRGGERGRAISEFLSLGSAEPPARLH